MKKLKTKLLIFIPALLVAFIYYYVALPAINIHSAGLWWFLIFALAVILVMHMIRRAVRKTEKKIVGYNPIEISLKDDKAGKVILILILAAIVIFLVGDILSSPFINARKYQQLMTVENRVFTEDIAPVDYNTIPLLDKSSASILGDRKMGSMADMVSQFVVTDEYSQINFRGRPTRVSPLGYASPIKWLTNQKDGIPAYMRIDMSTQETECVKLEQGIRYSKAEYFNRNIYRHLRFHYPTYIFDSQIFFEIDEDGVPYWVCPVKKFNIGLFGGQTVGRVVLCNAVTGECIDYAVGDVPQWIDKVYSAELLMDLYDYHGSLQHGFWNSVLSQRDCLQSTNGYNYIALDDDVWVYTGVTSVNADQSNVGFVLMNQRTMETRYYQMEGAIEDSAMSSAEGKVQNLGYRSTFPLLLNIDGEATYFMALKDAAGLVKMYAMVNVQQYQYVATGETIRDCEKMYRELLVSKGISTIEPGEIQEANGVIEVLQPVVLEGNTHYYLCLQGDDHIYDVDLSNTTLIETIRFRVGDRVKFTYEQTGSLCIVTELR